MIFFRYSNILLLLALSLLTGAVSSQSSDELQKVMDELATIKKDYENRISVLENQIKSMKEAGATNNQAPQISSNTQPARARAVSKFNPAVGVVLNGKFSSFSKPSSELAGFAIGHEGERGREGLGIGESEMSFSANVDDKFYGTITAAIVREEGEDKVELEEAYLQTLPGLQFIDGLSIKAGRAFWTLGYMNEHHAHADDFADRPLPYRAFLNKAYNDDGVELSYVLPTPFYSEIGGGAFRGDDFPFGGGDGEGIGAWSAYARVGSDIGLNQSFRIGGYALIGEAKGGRSANEDTVTFVGDTDLYSLDFRYTWAPTGNAREKEVSFQAETFWRDENGTYNDAEAGTGDVRHHDTSMGWYAQGVYKFSQSWRAGLRYSELESPSINAGLNGSALDGRNHDPRSWSAMVDWTNSEFSRVRFQWSNEKLNQNTTDNQFMIQYIVSAGAHRAHKY